MRTFDTPAPISTVLDVPAGHVRLIADDRADTAVQVRPADAAKGRDVQAAARTAVEYGDGVLRITAPAKTQVLGPSGFVEVEVRLPAGSHVEVRAAGVDFRGVGRLGDVAVEGAHASVEVEEAGSVRLTTRSGDVAVGRLTGSAEISTGKGDIRIAEAVSGTVVLRTLAGDVSVDAAAGVSASLDAGTGHGRIRNTLRNTGTADLSIHATTSHGDIVARGR
ncbi:DUF4097 family beta strand repeat-containing protein [Actinosynnema sp. NPDC059335]|uniref:DUF4097 family beta strand repeat-containing protein n=1 Tax=Actinosynnema sp. NPDC059335 TaxID=3346804 RepID=UPI00366B0735